MPTFNFTGPDGKSYSVQGPDGATPEQAFQVLQQQLASQPQAPETPKLDKYQQAAVDEAKANPAIADTAGLTRRLVHGATLGADNTLMAAALTPFEMIKRGTFSPAEGYNFAKAREDLALDESRKNTGALGAGAEILGGGVSGAGLASGGLTAARFLAPEAGLLARTGASAADAAGLGAFSGAMEGNGLAERGMNALKGGLLGGALGGATPAALSLLGAAASPIVSNIRARFNPEGFARSQVARGVSESGLTPQQITDQVRQAANEGQGMFTVADAMGNAGQRMLSTTARAPGQARTDVVNFLEGRQGGQGRRISNALAEGFDSPQTAAQTEARLTNARNAAADTEYGAIRSDAQPVDVSNVLARIDSHVAPYGVPHDVTSPDSITGALIGIRRQLANRNGSANDFNLVQRVRQEAADMAQTARQSGQGNRARLLGQVVRELDTSLENSSAGYQQANRNFAQATRDIEAVQAGRDAAMRGRTEDTIPTFQALGQNGQAAYRAGYVDPLISSTQGAAFGVNKARPLINDAFQAEAGIMAPGNALMQRRIGRENTMFQTRNAATGNSKTAENLADDAAMGVDPSLIGHVLSGNWSGALRSVLASGSNALSGNTPAVRQAVADMLMTRGQNANPAAFQRMIDETIQRIQRVQQIARSLGRGAAGGLAVTGSGQNGR